MLLCLKGTYLLQPGRKCATQISGVLKWGVEHYYWNFVLGSLTREHSSAKMAAGPVFSSGSIRYLHLRLLKLSIFLIFKWNLPNREAYSQPSLSASSGRC